MEREATLGRLKSIRKVGWTAVALAVVFLQACGSSQDVATEASITRELQSAKRPAGDLVCPDAAPANPYDAGPPADTRIVVLSGDFDGYPWCLVVEEFPQVGTCISLEGAAAVEGERLPEGEQLLSGSCDGPITGLDWHITGPSTALVVYGHAPDQATSVRFEREGSELAEVEVHTSPAFEGVTFFTAELPPERFPDTAVALAEGQEIERKSARRLSN